MNQRVAILEGCVLVSALVTNKNMFAKILDILMSLITIGAFIFILIGIALDKPKPSDFKMMIFLVPMLWLAIRTLRRSAGKE